MKLFLADLRVWWAQLLVSYGQAACRSTGGADSPYIPALKAAMTELDEAVREADKLRREGR